MVEDVLSVMDKYVQRKDPFTDRNSLGKLKFRKNDEKIIVRPLYVLP